MTGDPLRDLLRPGLKLVICGSAVPRGSAKARAYYAHPSNKFWCVLFKTRLTTRQFKPQEYASLLDCGIGLTDLAKSYVGDDAGLRRGDYDIPGFVSKIERFRPAFLAFNGKGPAKAVFGQAVNYGLQNSKVGNAQVFVLPSTSGQASGHWNLEPWCALAAALAEN